MKKPLIKALIGFIIPVAVILLLGSLNILLALGAFLIYLAILAYILRVTLFTVLGGRNYATGKTEQALKWFKRAYESKKAGVRSSVSYAYILLKNADLVKSEEILQKLLAGHPKSEDIPLIKSNLALVFWKKGDLGAATAMLEETMETYKTTTIYGSLGYLLLLKGDLEKALQFNLEAYEYNSTDKVILDNLGQNYYLLGKYDESKEIYETLVAKAPTFPEAYYNYGLLLLQLGNNEKALEMMEKARDCKFSYLSSISREEVETKIQETSLIE